MHDDTRSNLDQIAEGLAPILQYLTEQRARGSARLFDQFLDPEQPVSRKLRLLLHGTSEKGPWGGPPPNSPLVALCKRLRLGQPELFDAISRVGSLLEQAEQQEDKARRIEAGRQSGVPITNDPKGDLNWFKYQVEEYFRLLEDLCDEFQIVSQVVKEKRKDVRIFPAEPLASTSARSTPKEPVTASSSPSEDNLDINEITSETIENLPAPVVARLGPRKSKLALRVLGHLRTNGAQKLAAIALSLRCGKHRLRNKRKDSGDGVLHVLKEFGLVHFNRGDGYFLPPDPSGPLRPPS